MSRQTLNLGILAHVDAGKTTLTERLLYAAGVIDAIGSVDDGTTQTDSLALERQRGITIRSAVVSFAIGETAVNLIDTPGHPDFIAEVERVLGVLDGAVLVLSAVEGVQPQTRIVMRALQRLRIPTLLFVNKIDRAGAGEERVLREIAGRLTRSIVPMGTTRALGTRGAAFVLAGLDDAGFRARLAEVLAERDEGILAAFVEDESQLPGDRLRAELAAQTGRALAHPVFFGSAVTGAGVKPLMAGIAALLPSSAGDPDAPLAGTVFKIERDASGQRIAYARVSSGTIRTRDRIRFGAELEDKVTAIAVFERGPAVQRASVSAGGVAKLWGLSEIRIGDRIGEPGSDGTHHEFPPPTLESVVVARDAGDRARLRVALAQLAEQDPLIDVRWDDGRGELSVSLYGEVQQEVLQATLASDYGIDVELRDTTPLYVERPTRAGEAVEVLHAESNPFLAGLGLRVEPAGAGIEFRVAVDPRTIPLYVYKTVAGFTESVGAYVRETLREGLHGWQVTGCLVTLTECVYSIPDGPPSRRGSPSTAADFRKLTPLVVMQALAAAESTVCEPIVRAHLEVPPETLGAVLPALARLGAVAEPPAVQGELATIESVLPSGAVHELRRRVPGLTGGEGVLETEFSGYRPVSGAQPTRRRTTANPLNREEYLLHLARRVSAR